MIFLLTCSQYGPCKEPKCVDVPFYFFEGVSLVAATVSRFSNRPDWFLYLGFFGGFLSTHIYVKRLGNIQQLINRTKEEIEEIDSVIPELTAERIKLEKESQELELIEQGLKKVVEKDMTHVHQQNIKQQEDNDRLITKINELTKQLNLIKNEQINSESIYFEYQHLNSHVRQLIDELRRSPILIPEKKENSSPELDSLINELETLEQQDISEAKA